MRTRRFKAWNGAKGENSRIIEKIALYDDHDTMIYSTRVYEDDYDDLYYYPPNTHDKLGLFTDKIMDALECIRNGYGDMITTDNLFGTRCLRVIRFIDRELGEPIREFSLKGWENTKFAYAIKCSPVNTLGDDMVIAENNKLVPRYQCYNLMKFNTEDDANKYIADLNKRVAGLYKKYKNLKRTGDDDYDFKNIVKPFFYSIHNGDRSNLDWLWLDVVDEFNKTSKWIYKFEVIQTIVGGNYTGIKSINNYDQLLGYELFRRKQTKFFNSNKANMLKDDEKVGLRWK